MLKNLLPLVFLLIMPFQAPSGYPVSSATVEYSGTLSSSEFPISISIDCTAYITTTTTTEDVILEITMMGDDYSDDVPDDLEDLFILSNTEISELETILTFGTTTVNIPLVSSKENSVSSNYYGANILSGSIEVETFIAEMVWSRPTGILLYLNMAYAIVGPNETYTLNILFEYEGSDVDIYGDQSQLELIGYQVSTFLTTPTGILIIIGIVAGIVTLAFVGYYLNKDKTKKRKKSRMDFHR